MICYEILYRIARIIVGHSVPLDWFSVHGIDEEEVFSLAFALHFMFICSSLVERNSISINSWKFISSYDAREEETMAACNAMNNRKTEDKLMNGKWQQT